MELKVVVDDPQYEGTKTYSGHTVEVCDEDLTVITKSEDGEDVDRWVRTVLISEISLVE